MKNVVDANVFAAYYRDTTGPLGKHDLTLSPLNLFASFSADRPLYVDSGGHILKEWEGVVDPDWLRYWVANQIINDVLREVDVSSHPTLIKRLRVAGFPKSRDIWYVRLGATVAAGNAPVQLVTEDCDYFDPTKKKDPKARKRCLHRNSGPICKILGKEGVAVTSVCNADDGS